MTTPRFTKPVLDALRAAQIIGIRSGREHRFTGIWVVVVNDRVFVRSWNDKPTGWRQAFRDDSSGIIQIPSSREVRARAKAARGERLMGLIEDAYAEKYSTPGSRKYVVGFRRPRRRATTVELLPR